MRISFKSEVYFLSFSSMFIISITIIIFLSIATAKIIENQQRALLGQTTKMMISILEEINKKVVRREITIETAKKEAYESIKKIETYNLGEDGYFIILDLKGNVILHPTLEGENAYNYRDLSREKKYFVREQIEKAINGGGITEFSWKIANKDSIEVKMVYSEYYEPWGWIVESGSYRGDYIYESKMMVQVLILLILHEMIIIMLIYKKLIEKIFRPFDLVVFSLGQTKEGIMEPLILDEKVKEEYRKIYSGYNEMVYQISKKQTELENANIVLGQSNLEYQAMYKQVIETENLLRENYEELDLYKSELENQKNLYKTFLFASKDIYWEYDCYLTEIKIYNFDNSKQISIYSFQDYADMIFQDDIKKFMWLLECGRNDEIRTETISLKMKDDSYRWYKVTSMVVPNNSENDMKIFGIIEDIHEELKNKTKTEFFAYHDEITGLYNIEFLMDQLIIERHNNPEAIFIMIGIKNILRLKAIYSNNIIQIILFQMAGVLKESFNEDGLVFHIQEGKFGIIIRNFKILEKNYRTAFDLIKRLNYSDNISIPIILNICGLNRINLIDNNNELINRMNTAYELNSDDTDENILWIDEDILEKNKRRISIEKYLKNAIDLNELYLVYQPQYDIKGEEIVAYEALIRWKNPLLGIVSPAEFIPIAEDYEYIDIIGKFLIEEVCKFLVLYKQEFEEVVPISINASYKELVRNDYVSYLVNKLKEYNLSHEYINIEVTETSISKYIDNVVGTLNKLSSLGFNIHMDDFGTGYSSLNQLGKLPIDKVKIDKSFVSEIAKEQKMLSLTKLIIDVAHKLGMKTVAEGVENSEEYELLKSIGCDYYQGYYFSKPLNTEFILRKNL